MPYVVVASYLKFPPNQIVHQGETVDLPDDVPVQALLRSGKITDDLSWAPREPEIEVVPEPEPEPEIEEVAPEEDESPVFLSQFTDEESI